MTTPVNVPALDIDALMLNKYGRKLTANGVLERRIVANLIAHLEEAGFKVSSLFDSEEETPVADMKAAMELIFNLDEAWLRFANKNGGTHTVFLVLGNGEYIISDWNFYRDDGDGFNKAMEAFDVDKYL
jgi:hypothetical protein